MMKSLKLKAQDAALSSLVIESVMDFLGNY